MNATDTIHADAPNAINDACNGCDAVDLALDDDGYCPTCIAERCLAPLPNGEACGWCEPCAVASEREMTEVNMSCR